MPAPHSRMRLQPLVHCSDQEDYEVVRKIGRGKYSEVFDGYNVVNKSRCGKGLLGIASSVTPPDPHVRGLA